MFKFQPSYSFDALSRHVEDVRKNRVTLMYGDAIYNAIFYSALHPTKSRYPELLKKDAELAAEALEIWTPFENDVKTCVTALREVKSFTEEEKVYLTNVMAYGIIGCKYIDPFYRAEMMGDRLDVFLKCAKQSDEVIKVEICKAIEDFIKVVPLNAYEFFNSTDSSTNVVVNGIEMPENGILYGLTIALLPVTKRAMDLTTYLLNIRSMDCNFIPGLPGSNAMFDNDEGECYEIKKVYKNT